MTKLYYLVFVGVSIGFSQVSGIASDQSREAKKTQDHYMAHESIERKKKFVVDVLETAKTRTVLVDPSKAGQPVRFEEISVFVTHNEKPLPDLSMLEALVGSKILDLGLYPEKAGEFRESSDIVWEGDHAPDSHDHGAAVELEVTVEQEYVSDELSE